MIQQTTIEAYQAIGTKRAAQEAEILDYFKSHPEGLTDHELQTVPCLKHIRNAQPRRAGLAQKGLIVDSGKRRVSEFGRRNIVWEAA